MREVSIVGVRVELPANQPIVLLKESDGERYLPIWIGAVEATAIAFAQQGVETARPMTHDLLRDVVAALGVTLERVVIDDISDRVFYASLVFSNGVTVSARPSDAIALAVRTSSPVYAEEPVLDEAGIVVPPDADGADGDAEDEAGAGSAVPQEAVVERFREFLDTISPDDFDVTS